MSTQACGYMCVCMFWEALFGGSVLSTPQTLNRWKEGPLELGNSLRLESCEHAKSRDSRLSWEP